VDGGRGLLFVFDGVDTAPAPERGHTVAFYFQLDDGPYEVIEADTLDEATTRYAGWPITFEDLHGKI
jgi:hypothetical protein